MKILPEELKSILLKSGFINEKDIDAAIKSSQQIDRPLSDVLIFRGLITDQALAQLIAEHYKVPFISLKNKTIDQAVLDLVPENMARSYRMIPFEKGERGLKVAMEDPKDFEAIEQARRRTKLKLIPHLASSADITSALAQYKRNIKEAFEQIIAENLKKAIKEGEDLARIAHDVPVVKILETLLQYAVAEHASDIHIEALEHSVVVRFRLDGVLRDIITLPRPLQKAIVARIKILSELKIDEHRIPQDGRFKFTVDEDIVSVRVSIIPAFYDENVGLRLLLESTRPLPLEELGITGKNAQIIAQNLQKPYGLILITGPTGSGKSTTLYSILNILNSPEVNIWTIEDPIEYSINRVNQSQISPIAGYTFASGLRSLLRHDPNIMMVGEIRDSETVEMVIHSALTGHLVLSTLHTNNAAGAIPRFLDMGAEAFLVASTINVIVAQRLVRKICTACIEKVKPTDFELTAFKEKFGDRVAKQEFYRGKGCQECGGSGYKGRVGIFEVLSVSDAIRDLTLKRASTDDVEKQAFKEGMVSMLEDGLDKISAGTTTVEEVLRAVRE